MLTSVLGVVAGLALLVWGSERFVKGASATASNLGVSPLIIGLTVVGIGTSAPEIFVSAVAAFNGNPGVSVGNAVGSNIANIGLVVGIAAVVVPLSVHSGILKREFSVMFAVLVFACLLVLDNELDVLDGVLLLIGFLALMSLIIRIALRGRKDPLVGEYEEEIPRDMKTPIALVWLAVGLAVLLASSRMMVWGAVNIAEYLGVSDLVIGLTVVAVGTSLPEVGASVTSALKGEPDIAIGNVIGSNMFNLLLVLPLPALIAPGALDHGVVVRDFPVMLALSVLLFLTAYGFRGPGIIKRWEGGVLLGAFGAYQALLYAQSV